MTQKEIYLAALKKAFPEDYSKRMFDIIGNDYDTGEERPFQTIFSHQFAKAFWGDDGHILESKPAWEYHLQQMVLEEEPLKYLEKFL